MDNIYKLIFEATASGEIDKKIAVKILKSLKNEGIKETDDIAIIGMAARLPMCENLDDFWDIISNGLDCITPFPENRKKDIDDYIYYSRKHQTDEDTVKYQEGAYLKEIDKYLWQLGKENFPRTY